MKRESRKKAQETQIPEGKFSRLLCLFAANIDPAGISCGSPTAKKNYWTLLGLSWGTTLGLAYAQVHPQRVAAAVFGLVTTTLRREVERFK